MAMMSEVELFAAADAIVRGKKEAAKQQRRVAAAQQQVAKKAASARMKAQDCAAKGCDVRVGVDGQMYVHEHRCAIT